ncbi:unnamed protein product (macronuclear) [Paramecium tetraurelia]|uniref:TmcB/TmcC TPR repeats domain-containing protein n=1 Tax=Paramecium tetraurelia TaxID=5888 RepID=A0E3Y3_PARTE|nr:uncharacterized protein GSPATT00023173001 [Paramecium tetraurelia]CAK90000.1 unnamed protein product [Paramecium tetraurelia]|eukprot:XP_001457397.1 hypothetical protein (macronuclear) [Paramecium tetraurelia strain d4-2]
MTSSSKTDQIYLMTLFKEIKTSIFKVFCLILKEQEQTFTQTVLLSTIQLLQLLYIPFALKVNYIWKNNQVTDVINKILRQRNAIYLSYFEILLHVKDQGFSVFLYLFYSFSGLIVLIMLGLTLLVNQQNRKNSTNWIVLVVRISIKLMITILFFPINQIFFGLLACTSNSNGVSVLVYETDVVCWSNEHTIHGVLSIFIIFLFQIQINTFTLFLFEAKKSNTDVFAQRSGRQFSLFHIYITLSTMVYQLVETPAYSIIITLTMFVLSLHFFYQIKYSAPFYNPYVQKLWNVITAINCWTTIMINFAFFLEGPYFQNSLLGYALGIPILIGIIFKQQDQEIDLLFSNLNQAKQPNELISLCGYLLTLNEKSIKDQHSQLLLDAFLEIHEQTCPRLDCIMKNKQLLRQIQNKHQNRQIENKIIINELITQMLTFGIKMQPLNIDLRLYYSFFLIDEIKSPQLAFIELSQAENNSIPIDQQFIIYRYKKLIEDVQVENDVTKLETNNFINNQNIQISLNQKLEAQCILQLEFLAALEDEKPDLAKIDSVGFKILRIKKFIDKEWQKVQQQNVYSPSLYKIMSKYFFFVLSDEYEGNMTLMKQDKFIKLQINDLINLEQASIESSPIIILNTEQNNFGIIKDVNIASCSFLGFSKSDLIERKLSVIQPQIYINFHDQLIDNYLKRVTDIQKSKVEKVIFIKNKQGYIQQCSLQIKQLMTQNQEVFLIGKIGIELVYKPICYLICNTDGIIKEINCACIKLLRLDVQMIKASNKNIKDLFPDIMSRIPEILGKKNSIISFNINASQLNPQRSSSIKSSGMDSTLLDDCVMDESLKLQCQISEISIDLPNAGLIGYVFKFEKIATPQLSTIHNTMVDNFYKFNFKFNSQLDTYLGSYQNYMQTLHKISYDTSSIVSSQEDQQQQRQVNRKQTKKSTSISNGIKTVRLINGMLIDVEGLSEEEISEGEQNEFESIKQETKDSDSIIQSDYIFLKTKSSLISMIKSSIIPSFLNTLRYIISILIVGLLTLGYLQFFFDLNYQNEIQNGLDLFYLSNQRLSKLLVVQSYVQELKFMNLNYESLLSNYNFDELKDSNIKTLNEIKDLQSRLSQANFNLAPQYNSYQQEYEDSSIEMTQSNVVINYTFNEAIEQTLVKALSLSQQDLSSYTDDNIDLNYFETNSYNSIVYHNYVAQFYFYYYMVTVLEEKSQNVQIILILVTLILFIIYVACSILILKIKNLRDNILVLLLQVQEQQMITLKKNYEYFLQLIQSKEDEENLDYEEELRKPVQYQEEGAQDSLKTNDNDEAQFLIKKKRKKFENSHTILRNILAYFIYLIIDNNDLDSRYNAILPVLNLTSIIESYLRFGDNSFKQRYVDNNFVINFGNFDSQQYVQLLKSMISDIHKQHSENSNVLDIGYIGVFEQIFILNPCGLIKEIDPSVSQSECESFNDGIIGQGLSMATIKYIKYLEQALKNPVYFTNVRKTQLTYFKDSFQYLGDKLIESISNDFSVNQLTKVSLFTVFNLLMLFVYFFIWIPLVRNLIQSIIKTRLLFSLIPNNDLLKIKAIMQYLLQIRNPM